MSRKASRAAKLVIFDCDGTLVDSQNAIVAAMTHAYEAHGIAPPVRAEMLSVVGLSLPQAFFHLMSGHAAHVVHSVSDAYRDAFGQLRLDPAHHEPLFDGARQAIADLAAREDVLLGIATGKSMRGVNNLIAREVWHGHFHTIQTADNAPSKPDPGMILQAMAETGAEPDDVIMIGDTSYDIEMARAAGVHAVGVAWGYHPVDLLERSGAHRIVEDYAGLMRYLAPRLGLEEDAS